MKIESLTPVDLEKMINSDRFIAEETVPVSFHRAKSQLLNPDLRAGDILLNIARDDEGKIIGLIGALPARLSDNSSCAWNSGWWIDPENGREAAMPLFYTFLEQWEKKVLFSDLTPQTYKILSQINFISTQEVKGIRLYLRSPLGIILPQRVRFFRYMKGLLNAVDSLIDMLTVWRLKSYPLKRAGEPEVLVEEIISIDQETEQFIIANQGANVCGRDKKRFDWIRQNPWLLTSEDEMQHKNYPFSSSARQFVQYWIRFTEAGDEARKDPVREAGKKTNRESGKVLGFLYITIRDGHLKTPYFFYSEERITDEAVKIIWQKVLENRVSMITSFHPQLSLALDRTKLPVLIKRNILRYTGITQDAAASIKGDYFFQDGDGDAVFT